jgi:hypothetical protein
MTDPDAIREIVDVAWESAENKLRKAHDRRTEDILVAEDDSHIKIGSEESDEAYILAAREDVCDGEDWI